MPVIDLKYLVGLYCERKQEEACPLSWWGHPICGPCNCATEKGFDPSCNKTTGECVCKVNVISSFSIMNTMKIFELECGLNLTFIINII